MKKGSNLRLCQVIFSGFKPINGNGRWVGVGVELEYTDLQLQDFLILIFVLV
jgi:hypothetical protein